MNPRPAAGVRDADILAAVSALERRLIKRRALHLVLSPIERGIVNICSRLLVQAKSDMLQKTLADIGRKMAVWLAPHSQSRLINEGRKIAAANVRAAEAMGVRRAPDWLTDRFYILLLGANSFGSCHV